jgi:hypothetical protein
MPRKRKQDNPIVRPYSLTAKSVPFGVSAVEVTGDTIRWSQLRQRIAAALEAFPEAREALVESLSQDLGLQDETRIEV